MLAFVTVAIKILLVPIFINKIIIIQKDLPGCSLAENIDAIYPVNLLCRSGKRDYYSSSIVSLKFRKSFYMSNFVKPKLPGLILSLAIASIPHWQMDEPKAPLKRCLTRYVPRNMVYRPKSGFLDYRGTGYFDKEFIAYLRAAADDTSPIAFVLNKKPLLKACDWLSRRIRLPFQTLNCLWAITFVDRWYRSAREDVCRASIHTDEFCTEGVGGWASE